MFYQKFFSFRGRLRRRDFWTCNAVVAALIFCAFFILTRITGEPRRVLVSNPSVLTIDYLIIAWPQLAITVTRGHDRNISAAVSIALYALTEVAGLWRAWMPHSPFNLGALSITLVAGIGYLVVYGCLDGSRGRNRYGPSPKNPGAQGELDEIFS